MGYKSRETTAKTSDSQEAEGEGGRGEDAFVGIAKGSLVSSCLVCQVCVPPINRTPAPRPKRAASS